MSVPSIPKDQFLAIKQLWQTKLALEEKVKSLEAICNINGNLKSILENLTKEFRAIPGSSISDTTGGSTVVDPATINHELLGGLLGGATNDHQHLTATELAALHPAVTIVDTASVNLTINGQTLEAAVLPAGVDHNSLANLTTGDPHTQYTENSGSITQITTRNHSDLQNKNTETDIKHLTDAQVSALHAKQHAIDSTADHTSGITAGKGLIANANGLPAGSAHVTETATGVGLSVADPKTKLDIDGSIRLSSGNVIGSSFDATLTRLRNTIKFYGTDGDMVFETFYPATSSYRFFTGGRAGAGELHELLTLYKTNKVGVSVAIPSEKLDVDGNINITTGNVYKINGVDQTALLTAAKAHADNTTTAVHGATTVGYALLKTASAEAARDTIEIPTIKNKISETLILANTATSNYFDITLPKRTDNPTIDRPSGKIVLLMRNESGGDFTDTRMDRYDITWVLSAASPYIKIVSNTTTDASQVAAVGLTFSIVGGKIRVTASASSGGTWSINVYVKGQIVESADFEV